MKDLEKVNSRQLFSFWKNLSIALLVMMGMLFLSRIFPFYFSPIISLIAAAYLYTILYNNQVHRDQSCMLVPYAMFYCMIVYSFFSIIINVLAIWDIVKMPKELSFFNDPYFPSLILDPVCFIVLLVLYVRRKKLKICINCKLERGVVLERGRLGSIVNHESNLQIKNLILLFGILTLAVWGYYYYIYYKDLVNARDVYIFVYLNIIAFVIDEVYFASRYFNIYLDLKENGEIITEAELSDMTTKTYLRFYVICGNKIFINPKVADNRQANRFVIDTPFVTKRNVNGITTGEVHGIIQRLTGVMKGELRFFYGRKSLDISKHRLLRYFYFLDGKPEDYEMDIDGEWVDFEVIKAIYNQRPSSFATTMLADLSRMVTIILTQKIFDEQGYRRLKLKSYHPTFNLLEVREKDYDFQDDKWLKVAMFNSDVRGFQLKKILSKFKRAKADLSPKKNQ